MPLITAKCNECGKVFDTIVGSTLADAEKPVCECGADAERLIGGARTIMAKGYDWERLENPRTKEDRLELQAVLEHKAWMEANHDDRESGKLNIVERGPNWSRPFDNAERPRKFY